MAAGVKTGGRQKVTPNRIPAAVKEMILTALTNKGGTKYFEKIADEQPVAFCSLLGRILPTQIEGGDNPVQITEVRWMLPEKQ